MSLQSTHSRSVRMGAATTGIMGASPVAIRKRKLDPDKVADVAAVLSSYCVRQLIISVHCWLLLYPNTMEVAALGCTLWLLHWWW